MIGAPVASDVAAWAGAVAIRGDASPHPMINAAAAGRAVRTHVAERMIASEEEWPGCGPAGVGARAGDTRGYTERARVTSRTDCQRDMGAAHGTRVARRGDAAARGVGGR